MVLPVGEGIWGTLLAVEESGTASEGLHLGQDELRGTEFLSSIWSFKETTRRICTLT